MWGLVLDVVKYFITITEGQKNIVTLEIELPCFGRHVKTHSLALQSGDDGLPSSGYKEIESARVLTHT